MNENIEARWKGWGMGDYYCSHCMEIVSGNRELRCPNCHALMYTDEEYTKKLAEWKVEDDLDKLFEELEDGWG